MDLNYNFLNIIILFGAVQGFVLCASIYSKKVVNKAAVFMFLLFLFSLAFLNMMYAFLDLNLFQYYRPLHVFPFPYKWLIGPAFYFYIKNQFIDKSEMPYHKKEWYLFIPAILYGFARLYWFIISASENSYRITQVIVDSNYFRIQEVVYLVFTIVLGISALLFLKKKKHNMSNYSKTIKSVDWLKGFIIVFLSIHLIGFCLFSADLMIHKGQETFEFLYPSLIFNVAFIYWIGIIGFTKPKQLFNTFKLENSSKQAALEKEITEKLKTAIYKQEVYKNPSLTLDQFASAIEISPRDLSKHINEIHQMNFSEFLNAHRIEKVKKLLISADSEKYTFITLAVEAGFSSKSSFNAIFKKMVGISPSAYKRQQLRNK